MKANVWIVLVIMFFTLGLISCSDDDDEKSSDTLEGTWTTVYSQGYYKEYGVIVEEWDGETEDDDVTIFKPNGKMVFWLEDELIEDDYTYKNNKIYLENYILIFNVLKLTSTNLILELKVEIDNMILYEKQTLNRTK